MNGWAKRSIRLGSYDPIKKRITISPSLDQAMVPLICIERILFHEMLHQFLPAQKHQSGKTSIHHPEFNRFEKKYPYLEEADLWLRANMARLLRY